MEINFRAIYTRTLGDGRERTTKVASRKDGKNTRDEERENRRRGIDSRIIAIISIFIEDHRTGHASHAGWPRDACL